jgi:hypothetical protein
MRQHQLQQQQGLYHQQQPQPAYMYQHLNHPHQITNNNHR